MKLGIENTRRINSLPLKATETKIKICQQIQEHERVKQVRIENIHAAGAAAPPIAHLYHQAKRETLITGSETQYKGGEILWLQIIHIILPPIHRE